MVSRDDKNIYVAWNVTDDGVRKKYNVTCEPIPSSGEACECEQVADNYTAKCGEFDPSDRGKMIKITVIPPDPSVPCEKCSIEVLSGTIYYLPMIILIWDDWN